MARLAIDIAKEMYSAIQRQVGRLEHAYGRKAMSQPTLQSWCLELASIEPEVTVTDFKKAVDETILTGKGQFFPSLPVMIEKTLHHRNQRLSFTKPKFSNTNQLLTSGTKSKSPMVRTKCRLTIQLSKGEINHDEWKEGMAKAEAKK